MSQEKILQEKIPEGEIKRLALDLAKSTSTTYRPWEYSQRFDEYIKAFNGYYQEIIKYNKKCDVEQEEYKSSFC